MSLKALALALALTGACLADDFPQVLQGKWVVYEAGQPDRELEGRWVDGQLELTGSGDTFRFSQDGLSAEHNGLKAKGSLEGGYYLYVFGNLRYTFLGNSAIQIDNHTPGYWSPQSTQFLHKK